MSRVVINNISWNRPDGSNLFHNITFACNNEKSGLTGNNGTGKSVIAHIIVNKILPSEGKVFTDGSVAYFPQNLSIHNGKSLTSVFNITDKYEALKKITAGNGSNEDFILLENDWDLEQRLLSAMQQTGIEYLEPEREFSTLSGGEQVRCVLSAILITDPDFIVLDEPTNHLDYKMREFIYTFVNTCKAGLLVISHDRELLRLMDRIIEITPSQAKIYGGNFDLYMEQRAVEIQAIENEVQAADNLLVKRIKEKEASLLRQATRTKAAGNYYKDGGIPKVALNQLIGRGEKTLSRVKGLHEKRVTDSEKELQEAKVKLPVERRMKIDFINNSAPDGKVIISCTDVNYSHNGKTMLWKENLNFLLRGNERIHLCGINGSGKSTLLRLITEQLRPAVGNLKVGVSSIGVLDQEVSLLNNSISIFDNMTHYSKGLIPEHELRIRLARFLFFKDDVYKKAGILSGGERMRAAMACLFAANNSPELILLDEPTNNLDLVSIEQLTLMLNEYAGALLVVSHDKDFIRDIAPDRELTLTRKS